MFAQADCTLALAGWRSAAGPDKRDAYATYVAALDREAQAAIVLACRLAGPGEGRMGAPSVSSRKEPKHE